MLLLNQPLSRPCPNVWKNTLGKLDEAEPLYRKAVEIGDDVLGPDHPDLATWLNNLATLVRDRGDPDGAEPLQRRAVAIGERVLGPSHPDLGAQVINLASLLSVQGQYRSLECRRCILCLKERGKDGAVFGGR